jgi:hypothetical protein
MPRIHTVERVPQAVPSKKNSLAGARGWLAAIALVGLVGTGAVGAHALSNATGVVNGSHAAPVIVDDDPTPPPPGQCPGGPLHC